VVKVFQTKNCKYCGKELEEIYVQRFCEACGMPQPVTKDEDYFQIFGIERKFNINLEEIEVTFYRLSRVLHPDKFSSSSNLPDVEEAKSVSLLLMSVLNQAFQTLVNRDKLRSYLLLLEGVDTKRLNGNHASIPKELAAAWFDTKDAVVENPEGAEAVLAKFEHNLIKALEVQESQIMKFEDDYDRKREQEVLNKLAHEIQAKAFLKSISRDVQKFRDRTKKGLWH